MKLTFLIGLLFLFVSCGDLFMKRVEEQEVDQFATCSLDTESLAKIMTKNIQGDLNCLRSNLKFFIEIVKTDKPGYLSHKRLVEYINSNMTGVDKVTMDALAGIFDINTLLFGDDSGYIAKQNVDKLVDLFKDINKEVVENDIYTYFTADEKVSFFEHNRRKAVIFSTISRLSETFEKYIVANDKKIKVSDLVAKFKNIENKEIVDNIQAMLFLKKTFLGGNIETLSSEELVRLIGILANAGKITYDFINLPDTEFTFTQDEQILQILKEDLLSVYNSLFYKEKPNEPIVDYEQLTVVVEKFFPEFASYLEYKNSILKIKEVFLGSNSEVITAGEISTLVYDVLYTNVAKGVFFYDAYAFNEDILNSNAVVVNNFKNLRPLVKSSQDQEFLDLFNRISKSESQTKDLNSKGYKYFHGSNYIPLFDYDFKRNARGMFEVAVYEYLAKKFFVYYGTEDATAVGDYVMSLEQMEKLMVDLGEFFVGEGYVTEGKEKGTAETITLITTLFHPSSNGDSRIEINEFVELVVTMTSSLQLGSDMQKELREKCGEEGLEKIHPGCYRLGMKKFMQKEIENDKTRSDYLPRMAAYMNSLSDSDYDAYIRAAAKFSRTCTVFDDGTEVPMSNGDFIVSWAGFLAIEQSILTFDTDKSGVLEPREVNIAYGVYKSAIEALIEPEFMKRFSYGIFQYIVKYKRVPDIPDIKGLRSFWKAVREGSHLVQFLVRPQKYKVASADRMTFAKVLQIISENSPSALEDPFDCELLRDAETEAVQESFEVGFIERLVAMFAPMGDSFAPSGNSNLSPYEDLEGIPQNLQQLPPDVKILLMANPDEVPSIQAEQQKQLQQQQQAVRPQIYGNQQQMQQQNQVLSLTGERE